MDNSNLAKNMVLSVKAYVSKRLEELQSSISSLSKSLEDIGPIQNMVLSMEVDLKDLKSRPLALNGKDGEDGKSVTADELIPLIKSLLPEVKDGQDGRDGLDALDVQILPAINDLKSYPRGVYASHNGGLWKSFKQTEGMDGWECVVDGVGDISIDYDGERGFAVKMTKSSGKELTKGFSLPMVIDRGIFRDNQEYKKFDGVTHGGSFWISQKDLPEGKPGSSDDWRLSVKRGRDGRESVKIERSGPVKV